MTRRYTRRQALAAGAASLGYFYTAPSFAAAKIAGANGKLCVVGIGVGGKGGSDIDQAGDLMEVVALCDVDEGKLAPKAKKWPGAKTFSDYRKLFDDSEILKTMDAATISTPDHNHAIPAALAIKNKKHVYVQKPLTHTVFEAHHLRKLAKQYGVCTQMGNQGTAATGLRRGVELIQGGIIGPVKEVHVWTNRPIWPQAPKVTDKLPPEKADLPKGVNWEAFLGPAADRPYAKGIHPFAWRGFWDFGTGAIGDMACHTANMAFMALKLGHPNFAEAEAGGVNPLTCPSHAHVTLKFPARGDMPPVTLHWYEGQKDGKKLTPPDDLLGKVLKPGEKLANSGSLLVGEKGLLFSPNDYGSEYRITGGADDGSVPTRLPRNNGGDGGQKKEWVEAIKANKPEMALSNFDYASMLTAAFLLGNVAIRAGKPFEFDGETLTAKNCPEAAQFITKEYRKGWNLLEKV